MKKTSAAVLSALLLVFAAALSKADPGDKIDELIKEKKYLSAVQAIKNDPNIFNSPKGFARYVHLIIQYRAMSSNFHVFSLRDLENGETLDDVRRVPGATTMVEPDLEATIYEKLAQNPDSPEINFAVGEYLSRMTECECGHPKLFVGDAGDDVAYFHKAIDKGVFDYWSLFRLGLEYHYAGDLPHASDMYRRALIENPGYIPASYNLSVVLFLSGDHKAARTALAPIMDDYPDNVRNSDAHHLMAKIEEADGNKGEAEAQYRMALHLNPLHEIAGPDYMEFLKKNDRQEDYVKLVVKYLSTDWSTPYTFNVFLDYLIKSKPTEADRKLFAELEKMDFAESAKVGAFNYNLGRFALLIGERVKALDRFRLSLKTFEHMKNPPEGSVDALKSLIEQTEKTITK